MTESNRKLISMLKYSNLSNGEVAIKINDEMITAYIKEMDVSIKESHLTEINLKVIVKG